ncbi:MAG TPA: outer membrane beta-barrel protein [Pyrinomonadaceae bacterium]|nr:outer membrane beta-barrel protein [Pyrinomonadaceae bacterium]
MRKFPFAAAAALALILSAPARAQDDEGRFEVGGQFTVANLSNGRGSTVTSVPCNAPCTPTTQTSFSNERGTEPGVGARFGYGVNRHLTLEAEANFFPRDRDEFDPDFTGGRKVQALFGVKAGQRYESAGVFAKARAGFVHFGRGNLRPRQGVACILVVPPPLGCYEGTGRTDFAVDLGGVFELYPSKKTIVRFDVGDTILRAGDHLVPVIVNPPSGTSFPARAVVAGAPAETTHNLQASVGLGFRF